MDSKESQAEVEDGLPPVYFCNISVAYKKGKKKLSTHNKNLDVVSRFKTPAGMHKDKTTMHRIHDALYGSAYKGEKHALVRSVNSYKVVGYVSSTAL